jgi:hypothetical protein
VFRPCELTTAEGQVGALTVVLGVEEDVYHVILLVQIGVVRAQLHPRSVRDASILGSQDPKQQY